MIRKNGNHLFSRLGQAIAAIGVLTLTGILGWTVWTLPPFSDQMSALISSKIPISGVDNPVTAVLLNFRGYGHPSGNRRPAAGCGGRLIRGPFSGHARRLSPVSDSHPAFTLAPAVYNSGQRIYDNPAKLDCSQHHHDYHHGDKAQHDNVLEFFKKCLHAIFNYRRRFRLSREIICTDRDRVG